MAKQMQNGNGAGAKATELTAYPTAKYFYNPR